MADLIGGNIDINNTSTTVAKIFCAYLTGIRTMKDEVNELFKVVQGEFNKDPSPAEKIKSLNDALDDPNNTDKWEMFRKNLVEVMRSPNKDDFNQKVTTLVNKLRPPVKEPEPLPYTWTIILGLVCLVLILISGWYGDILNSNFVPGFNYLLVLFFMLCFTVVLGMHTTGRLAGVLISKRKLMSLSRLQIVIWTIVILSAYLTIVLSRIHASINYSVYSATLNETVLHNSALYASYLAVPDPLGVGIDWRLWALMGISTASLIGSPLVLDSKKNKQPTDSALKNASQAVGQSTDVMDKNREGVLYANPSIADAKFTDVFEGDEISNTSFVDLSKVQMFWFTVIAALSYVILTVALIGSKYPGSITNLPELSEGLIGILLISHAGYLANKSIDRTGSEQPED